MRILRTHAVFGNSHEFFNVHNEICSSDCWTRYPDGTHRCDECDCSHIESGPFALECSIPVGDYYLYTNPSSSSARLNAIGVARRLRQYDVDFWLDRRSQSREQELLDIAKNELRDYEECLGHLLQPHGVDPSYQIIRDTVGDIIDEFELLLNDHGIVIPDEARTGDESEAAIYGGSHARLLDAVQGHVERLLRDMREGTA